MLCFPYGLLSRRLSRHPEEAVKLKADVVNYFSSTVTDSGFTAHMLASAANLRRVRELVGEINLDAGAVETARLVVSELIANAVTACGDRVPLIVEVGTRRRTARGGGRPGPDAAAEARRKRKRLVRSLELVNDPDEDLMRDINERRAELRTRIEGFTAQLEELENEVRQAPNPACSPVCRS